MIDLPTDEYWIEVKILSSTTNRPEPTEIKSFETNPEDEGFIRDVFDEVTRKLEYQVR